MKKYISILLIALTIVSCKDYRYDEMVNDTAYFPKSDLLEYMLTVTNDDDYVYNLWVHKGGYFQKKYAGKVEISYAYLVEYNNQNNTEYEILDDKYYTLQRDFVMEDGENEYPVPVTFRVKELLADFGYRTFYLPLSVKSLTPESEVYEDKSNVMLAFTLKQPLVTIDSEWKGEQYKKFTGNESSYEIDITAIMDVNAPEDFNVLYSRDETLLKEGELELSNAYYSYNSSVAMLKGEKYAENYLKINVAEMPVGEWVIPVRLTSSNSKIGMLDDTWLSLTVTKGELDAVIWSGDYLQGEKIIIGGSNASGIRIGEFTDITAVASADESWVRPAIAGSNIVIELDENNTGKERSATITVRNTSNNLAKSITLIQADVNEGIPLNKEIWTLEAYSDNCTKHLNDIYKMYDGQWRKSASEKDSFTELNDRASASDPFVLTFNLGIEQTLNSFGLMGRQQWTKPVPKRVKIEISTDNQTWTTVGKNQNAEGILAGYTEVESNIATYSGMIKWFEFEQPVKANYIRLSLYESWYNDGKVVCIEEIFASLK